MLYSTLKGGLGNIFFIVATLKSLAIDRKQTICVSDYTNTCTRREEESFWIKTVLSDIKKTDKRPREIKVRYKERGFKHQKIPETDKGLELDGYFQSEKYFKHNRRQIVNIFTKYKKQIIKKLQKKLPIDKKTISIHIRRTDYIKYQHAHVVQDLDYYKSAIERLVGELGYKDIEELNKNYTFVVFSDDIKWCKTVELFNSLENVLFMEKNKAIEDIYLMSMCNHHIIANSTFSWWGAWLNTNKEAITICPSKWFNPNYIKEQDWQDIYCEGWIKL
jgi:hypothetical protein